MEKRAAAWSFYIPMAFPEIANLSIARSARARPDVSGSAAVNGFSAVEIMIFVDIQVATEGIEFKKGMTSGGKAAQIYTCQVNPLVGLKTPVIEPRPEVMIPMDASFGQMWLSAAAV